MEYGQASLFAVISCALSLVPVTVKGQQCDGMMHQTHSVGAFNFETNSRTESSNKWKRYVTCVRNLDTTSDLQIHWYIPGPHKAWIPPGELRENGRWSSDLEEIPLQGCIRYGNLTETTAAQFVGSAADGEATEREQAVGCDALGTAMLDDQEGTSSTSDRSEGDIFIVFTFGLAGL